MTTFPARAYSVNGERRSFALLRPISDATAQDRIRDLILAAYQEHEAALVAVGSTADIPAVPIQGRGSSSCCGRRLHPSSAVPDR